MGGANALLSSPAPLVWEGPSHLPLLISLASLLCPQGPTQPGGDLEGRGSTWELSRLPGPEWAGQLPSAPHPLLLEGPSHLPLLVSPASFLCPQDPCGLDGALEGGVLAWELSRLPGLSGPGDCPPLLSRSSWRVAPACLSSSPQPQGHRSCLASTSPFPSVPLHPTGSLWGSSCLLGRQSPPPWAGRHPTCGETLTPHLPTWPSSFMSSLLNCLGLLISLISGFLLLSFNSSFYIFLVTTN